MKSSLFCAILTALLATLISAVPLSASGADGATNSINDTDQQPRSASPEELALIAYQLGLDHFEENEFYQIITVDGQFWPSPRDGRHRLSGYVLFEPRPLFDQLCVYQLIGVTGIKQSDTYDWHSAGWGRHYWKIDEQTPCELADHYQPPAGAVKVDALVPSATVLDVILNQGSLLRQALDKLEDEGGERQTGDSYYEALRQHDEAPLVRLMIFDNFSPVHGIAFTAHFAITPENVGTSVTFSVTSKGFEVLHTGIWVR